MVNRCNLNSRNNVSLDINQESDVSTKPLIYREEQKTCTASGKYDKLVCRKIISFQHGIVMKLKNQSSMEEKKEKIKEGEREIESDRYRAKETAGE